MFICDQLSFEDETLETFLFNLVAEITSFTSQRTNGSKKVFVSSFRLFGNPLHFWPNIFKVGCQTWLKMNDTFEDVNSKYVGYEISVNHA